VIGMPRLGLRAHASCDHRFGTELIERVAAGLRRARGGRVVQAAGPGGRVADAEAARS
jgi:hypothetical protein